MIERWQPTQPTQGRKGKIAQPPTPAQRKTQHRHAVRLCEGATDEQSQRLADKMVMIWLGCGCAELQGLRGNDTK